MKKTIFCVLSIYAMNYLYAEQQAKPSYSIILSGIKDNQTAKEFVTSSMHDILLNSQDFKIITYLDRGHSYNLSYKCINTKNKKFVDSSLCNLTASGVKLYSKFPSLQGGSARTTDIKLDTNSLALTLNAESNGYIEIVNTSANNSAIYSSNVFFIRSR